ncbi:MAG: hypothetical protein FD157_3824 [Rhodocyclaceae bacterium]|jgi:hypothetical protein|nr:MAG: hypothetical protein FD157_3824 [Rhodocyclaceae bacterium]TND05426.1 MAG: hypothetical protein FD118_504 [Rhodocyclaceae bacterium]
MAAIFRCKLTVCVAPVSPILHTHLLFNAAYRESTESAIDEFLTRLQSINRLSPHPNTFDPLQGQLVLLGVIAAVESYLRTLFRRLIAIDFICQESVQRRDVSFGAAIHLSKEMLPEAILERISFITRSSIEETLRELLAIRGKVPSELDLAIEDYARVCQLRHCAVHRFGKLGVSNAIFLGLSDHKELLEKPLQLNYSALQNAIGISTGLVKTINNFLFNEVLSRLPPSCWTGKYRSDKRLFLAYYALFADTVSSIGATAEIRQLYDQFMYQRARFAAGQPF